MRSAMNIGLIDVDSHNFPNLALMKLSAWHKSQGDTVEWWWGFGEYDRVYMSKVFDETYSPDIPEPLNAREIFKGGTGYGLDNRLPDEVEHIYPDYQYATVYVLTNYNTTMEENLFRIYALRDMGFNPYVMVYDKPNAPREIRLLQRWCNNRLIFWTEPDFYKFDPKRG